MFNHLVHRTFLQELTFLIAILAVVEVDAAVCVCTTVLILSERHATTLAELRQLTRQQGSFFDRKRNVVCLESLWILICHKVALWWAIGSFTIAPVARNLLLGKEIRHF